MQAPYGYYTGYGYRGYIPWLNRMVSFPTEQEYLDILKED